jgi:hypothetical protein
MILANNMLEDFVAWLRQKGVDTTFISLKDIDCTYVQQFVTEKKLIESSDDSNIPEDADIDEGLLEKKAEKHTKPKKIRRKT